MRQKFNSPLRHAKKAIEAHFEIGKDSRQESDVWINAIVSKPLGPFAHVEVFVHETFLKMFLGACLYFVARACDETIRAKASQRFD